MDEKHLKSFPEKGANLDVNKFKQTFLDFTHGKIGEKLSAGNSSGLSNKQRNSDISTDTETINPDANVLQVSICSDVSGWLH